MIQIREEKMNDIFTKYHITFAGLHLCVLHRFTGGDMGDPHDHPWDYTTHILKGGYVEEVYNIQADGKWNVRLLTRKEGDVISLPAQHIHRIIHLPEGECWTMVTTGGPVHVSSFYKFTKAGVKQRYWYKED